MGLQDIKETKRYGRTDGQRENSIPPLKLRFGRGYKYESCKKNWSSGFPTSSDTNQPKEPQKKAKSFKFRI